MSRKITSTHIQHMTTELLSKQSGRLILTKVRDVDSAVYYSQGRIIAMRNISDQFKSEVAVGSIYLGKVSGKSPNIGAFFVDIQPGLTCFLPFKEVLLNKVINRSLISSDEINVGDEIVVQITREASKGKLCSCSCKLSLSSPYIVINDGRAGIGFSSKLSEENKALIKETIEQHNIVTESYGLVIRTAAEECSQEQLIQIIHNEISKYQALLEHSKFKTCYSCLFNASNKFEGLFKDLVYLNEIDEIITDDCELFNEAEEYCMNNQIMVPIRFYSDNMLSLSKLYSLENLADKAFDKQVWLNSGAFLYIEHTEALTVIDVNTGKYEGRGSKEDTAYMINQEAAIEIAYQCRLRNLSGIIIIDFINMNESNRQSFMVMLNKIFSADRNKINITCITPLGLVEMSRKKTYKELREQY